MLSRLASIHRPTFKKTGTVIGPLTKLSATNGDVYLNYNNYKATAATVFTFLNTTNLPVGTYPPTAATITGTIKLDTATTVSILIIGGGGGGGSGSQGGGGASSGRVKFQKLALTAGTYAFRVVVGGGGGGGGYVTSGAYVNGGNGYGRVGGTSQVTLNGNTYTAEGGCPGGTSYFSNAATSGAYGGGAGATDAPPSTLPTTGSTFNGISGGGSNFVAYCAGGGGGGSYTGNGNPGTRVTINGDYFGLGGLGALPIGSNHSLFNATPIANFTPTQFWAEGGHGACTLANATLYNIPSVTRTNSLAGKSAGAYYYTSPPSDLSTVMPTNPTNHTGSGGSGAFANNSLTSDHVAPAGANGLVILAW